MKNQSRGHAKKVECSSTFMARPRAVRRTKNAQVRQLQRKLSNVRPARAGKATAMEIGLNVERLSPSENGSGDEKMVLVTLTSLYLVTQSKCPREWLTSCNNNILIIVISYNSLYVNRSECLILSNN